MGDGPLDFQSGYFFESQKGISDRRAGLGLDQHRFGTYSPGYDGAAVSSGDAGTLVAAAAIIILEITVWTVINVLPLILRFGWEIFKLAVQLIARR
jgi:hypothetical protein